MIGKCSTFGGPIDSGMSETEGLGVFEHGEADKRPDLFMPRGPNPAQGASKRLRHNALYFAYRYQLDPKPAREELQSAMWMFTNPKNGLSVVLSLVDWGPNEKTGRIFDISPYAANLLLIDTDQEIQGNPI